MASALSERPMAALCLVPKELLKLGLKVSGKTAPAAEILPFLRITAPS